MDMERALKRALRSRNAERIRSSFQSFYECNFRLVFRVLIDTYGKDDQIEDDVQESFLALLDNPSRLLSVDRIVDYWIATAKFICHRRKKKQSLIDPEEEIPIDKKGIPELLHEDEFFSWVEQQLGHPDADIVILHAAYDYSEKEIARRLHIGVDSVHYRYKKGIKTLKRRIDREEGQS